LDTLIGVATECLSGGDGVINNSVGFKVENAHATCRSAATYAWSCGLWIEEVESYDSTYGELITLDNRDANGIWINTVVAENGDVWGCEIGTITADIYGGSNANTAYGYSIDAIVNNGTGNSYAFYCGSISGVAGTKYGLYLAGSDNNYVEGRLDVVQGTLTGAATMLNGTATWSSAPTTFTAWKLNVTDNASSANSLFLDFQVNGGSKFYVRKDGFVYADTVRSPYLYADDIRPVQYGGPIIYNSENDVVASFGNSGGSTLTTFSGDIQVPDGTAWSAPSIHFTGSLQTGFLLQSAANHVVGIAGGGAPIATFGNTTWSKYSYGVTPYFITYRYNGSYGAISPILANDYALIIEVRPYDGVDASDATAAIRFQATEDHTAAASGTKIVFQTNLTGSNTTITTAQCIGYQFVGPSYTTGTFEAPSYTYASSTGYGYLYASYSSLANLWTAFNGSPAFGVGASGVSRVAYATTPTIYAVRIQGSYGAETAVTSGQGLGNIGFRSYDGATALGSTNSCAGMSAIAAETHSATGHGAYLEFYTTGVGNTSDTCRNRIDSNGIIVFGSQVNGSVLYNGGTVFGNTTPVLQVTGRSSAEAGIALNTGANSVTGSRITGAKRRSNVWDTMTAVVSGDNLFHLTAEGADGTTFVRASNIFTAVDGAVSSGIVPGRLVFQTAQVSDGALVSAMRIYSDQGVTINNQTGSPGKMWLRLGDTTSDCGGLQIGNSGVGQQFASDWAIGGSVTARPGIQGFATSGSYQSIGLAYYGTNNGNAGNQNGLILHRSRNGTPGSFTATASGDNIGWVTWTGDDGAAKRVAAGIKGVVDGTVSSGIVPGRIEAYTTDASGNQTLALTINSLQQSVFQAGSYLLPSVTFGSDTDSGIWGGTFSGIPGTWMTKDGVPGFCNSVGKIWHLNFGNQSVITLASANGSAGAMTAITDGNEIGRVAFTGFNGTDTLNTTTNAACIYAGAAGNHAPTPSAARGAYISFITTDTSATTQNTRNRIAAGGQLVWGTNREALTTYDSGVAAATPDVQVTGTAVTSAIGLSRFSASGSSSILFGRSLGAAVATYTETTAETYLGSIIAQGVGVAGAGFRRASAIHLVQDAAAGSNIVPGRIVFETARVSDGALTEALRIDSAQVAAFASEVYVDSTTDVVDNDTTLLGAAIFSSGGIAALKKITAISTIESSAGVIGSSVTAQTTPSWAAGSPTAQGLLNTNGLNFTAPGAPNGTSVSTVFNHFGATFLTFATKVNTVIADGSATFAYTTDATTTSDGSVRMAGGLSVAKTVVANAVKSITSVTAADVKITSGTSLAAEEQFFYYEAPTNKTYALIPNASYARTMVQLSGVKTSSGTCTIKLQINGVDASNTLNVNTGEQTLTFTDTTLAVGERLTLVVTSVVGAVDLEFTLESSKS
jgi:hypothetical protein